MANYDELRFVVVQLKKISSHPIVNIRKAVVKFSNSSLSLGWIKREVQLGNVRIEMNANIVSLDDLFKRFGVNAEKEKPQYRSLWDTTSYRKRR